MISLVQTVQGNGGGYVNSFTKSITPSAGNMLTICLAMGAANTVTVTDNKGNTWLTDVSIIQTGQRTAVIYHAENVASGATTITFQFGASQYADSAVIIQEWSGLNSSSDLDKIASSTVASGTSYAVGPTSTTLSANELIIGCNACTSNTPSFTGDASYTNLITQAGYDLYTACATQYRVVSSTGAYSWTMTSSSSAEAAIALATFKAPGSAPPPTNPAFLLNFM